MSRNGYIYYKTNGQFLLRFDKALRVIAYVCRFIQRCRNPAIHLPAELRNEELTRVQGLLIEYTQRQAYSKEYSCLLDKKQILGSSSIRNLNPFIDQRGILRSCGHVRASTSFEYDERHPIIIPANCDFSRLLVRFTHHKSQILDPKDQGPGKIYHKLLQGFAGPFDIKTFIGRACKITKSYVCVFVCFSTKAIHLEATTDLTTERFLAAFSRFIARRGLPQQMYSDNGETFVGVSSVLLERFLASNQGVRLIQAQPSKLVLAFQFPWRSSHGRIIEACLNSRPISPMSEDPTDLLALSPGHLLVGGPLLSINEPVIQEEAISIINRWRRLKALYQQFCFRWKNEYLKELHKRNKWQSPTRDIQVGDMVIIKEENLTINEWRLGRVLLACPGIDDKVRVVDVLTARGVIRRPIARLVLLPTEANNTSD
ncbi:uncharacterized protein LOC135441074 [Drosophila montana]|uniref:uncharacterized protein LOC135441074 n=1 Tax=Drosophila montana TaxID=40370 RepID=UPI00313BC339